MKIKSNPYHYTSYFDRNCCALLCFSYAFKIDYMIIKQLFKLAGRKRDQGCGFHECKRVLETLGVIKQKNIVYTTNKNGLLLKTFCKVMKGKFIINHPEHISYFQNGTIIDEYLYGNMLEYNSDLKFREKLKIVGWWEITNKYLS